jgi:adenylate cyclase
MVALVPRDCAEARAMLGELLPCGGGEPVVLLKPRVVLGRLLECDVPLRDSTVSGRHCQLEFSEGYWLVRDLGSRNGTRVNGAACQTKVLLPGDVLSICKHRYTISYDLQAERPPPDSRPGAAMPEGGLLERAGMKTVRDAEPAGGSSFSAEVRLGELIPCGGGEPIALRATLLAVGRDRRNDIVIPCATVSARHCELQYTDGYWWVRDVGSRNGVFVNGEKTSSKRLDPGTTLAISKHRYRVDYTGPQVEPPAAPKVSLWRRMLGGPAAPGAESTPGNPPSSPLGGASADDGDEPGRRRWLLDDPNTH